MVCGRCSHRIRLPNDEIRYCRNYVSCRKKCSSTCYLHTPGGRQRCRVDRNSGSVVVIFLAYNGVTNPYVWERWLDALDPESRLKIKFLAHADLLEDQHERGIQFIRRYLSEWDPGFELAGQRGDFPVVVRTLQLLAEALYRHPHASHYCVVTGDTIPVCEPSKLLDLPINRSFMTHAFLCLGPRESVLPVNRVMTHLERTSEFGVEPHAHWWSEESDHGFGLLNHESNFILSNTHAVSILEQLVGENYSIPLREHAVRESLIPFGINSPEIARDFRRILYSLPDEYVIGNALAIAIGRENFTREVTNTSITAYMKYPVRNRDGTVGMRARMYNTLTKHHPATNTTLHQILQAVRSKENTIPHLKPSDIGNVLFFRKVGPRIDQWNVVRALDLEREIVAELWPEIGVEDIPEESEDESSDNQSADSQELASESE